MPVSIPQALATAPILHLPVPVEHPAVSADKLTKVYGRGDTAVRALDEVSVSIATGKLTAIMGPSGSGKSTLMHCLAGLEAITSGDAFVGKTKISGLSQRQLTKLRREHIGFIFQAFNLVPTLSAKENILLPSNIAHRAVDQKRFRDLTETLGLSDRLSHRPSELSGGQQQRVAIARALVSAPEVVFADEPTGNLDSHSTDQVLHYLRHVVDTYQQTVVMVTHEAQAAATADTVLFLSDGRVVAQLDSPTEDSVLAALRVVADPQRLARALNRPLSLHGVDALTTQLNPDEIAGILSHSGLNLDPEAANEVALLLTQAETAVALDADPLPQQAASRDTARAQGKAGIAWLPTSSVIEPEVAAPASGAVSAADAPADAPAAALNQRERNTATPGESERAAASSPLPAALPPRRTPLRSQSARPYTGQIPQVQPPAVSAPQAQVPKAPAAAAASAAGLAALMPQARVVAPPETDPLVFGGVQPQPAAATFVPPVETPQPPAVYDEVPAQPVKDEPRPLAPAPVKVNPVKAKPEPQPAPAAMPSSEPSSEPAAMPSSASSSEPAPRRSYTATPLYRATATDTKRASASTSAKHAQTETSASAPAPSYAEPMRKKPAQTEPMRKKPAHTEPMRTKPISAEPVHTKARSTKANNAEVASTEVASAEIVVTESIDSARDRARLDARADFLAAGLDRIDLDALSPLRMALAQSSREADAPTSSKARAADAHTEVKHPAHTQDEAQRPQVKPHATSAQPQPKPTSGKDSIRSAANSNPIIAAMLARAEKRINDQQDDA